MQLVYYLTYFMQLVHFSCKLDYQVILFMQLVHYLTYFMQLVHFSCKLDYQVILLL